MINRFFLTQIILSLLVLLVTSCEEPNVHGDTLAKGSWKIIELTNLDTTNTDVYSAFPGAFLAFNICQTSMNNEWGTDREKYGECSFVVSHKVGDKFTQDEYRFHIRSEESLEIKLLPNHSDRMLPNLTGPYTYHIDGRNMVMRYTGTDKPEIAGMEIHCWDWSPQ